MRTGGEKGGGGGKGGGWLIRIKEKTIGSMAENIEIPIDPFYIHNPALSL
jgi:hypothetical protein